MNSKKILLLIVFLVLVMINGSGHAQSILYVPFDNRPVSLDYIVDTVEKGGFEIRVPPEEILANRTKNGNSDL